MKYELRSYNGQKFGPGWYFVADKLIRQTAKVTESHATDIFYDLQWMDEHRDEAIDQLIMIRELGTWMRPVNNGVVEWDPVNGMPLQCWRVWSNGDHMWTERVTLREVE